MLKITILTPVTRQVPNVPVPMALASGELLALMVGNYIGGQLVYRRGMQDK